MKTCDEAAVILYYAPRVLQLCRNRWLHMPIDEKVAEANFFLLCAIRTPSIAGTGFWDEYARQFTSHMDAHCRSEGRRAFACRSLDAAIGTKNPYEHWTLGQCLPGAALPDGAWTIRAFLGTLPPQTRNILWDLADGVPRAQVLRRYGLTHKAFHRLRRALQRAYREWEGNEPLSQA